MASPLLEIRDLKVSFRTDDGVVRAVDGVSATLHEGETLGIVGESGSGKSVTMMSVMRLITDPNAEFEGEVLYKGTDLMSLPQDRIRAIRGAGIAMIFQDPMTSLNPVYKVGWQIEEQIREHEKIGKQAARERAVELLAAVGIPNARERIDAYPHEFSGGMRQRVMIAMAVSCNPDVLIADEPTTALDVTIQAQILNLIKKLKQDFGTAVVLITHDMGVVADMADRIVGHVRGPDRRAGHATRAVLRSAAPLHLGPAGLDRPARPATATAACRHSRNAAVAVAAAPRMRVQRALRPPVRPVLGAAGAARPERQRPPGRLSPEQAAEAGCPGSHHPSRARRGAAVTDARALGACRAEAADLRVLDEGPEIAAGQVLLRAEHLKKYFPIRAGVLVQREVARVHAVDDVSFELRAGETLGLVGESGCGKSTLARCIARLYDITSGSVIFEGTDISKLLAPPAPAGPA